MCIVCVLVVHVFVDACYVSSCMYVMPVCDVTQCTYVCVYVCYVVYVCYARARVCFYDAIYA